MYCIEFFIQFFFFFFKSLISREHNQIRVFPRFRIKLLFDKYLNTYSVDIKYTALIRNLWKNYWKEQRKSNTLLSVTLRPTSSSPDEFQFSLYVKYTNYASFSSSYAITLIRSLAVLHTSINYDLNLRNLEFCRIFGDRFSRFFPFSMRFNSLYVSLLPSLPQSL